ncbi:MAG: CHAD domain-containing protein [Chloroflexi bacterium]|nr:CHAD domain-containing protein [Chloroflexota bacterium]
MRSLRWQAQLLGRVRDLDVLLEDLFSRDRTGLHHPISTAKAQRDRMHRKLVSGLTKSSRRWPTG